MNKSGRKANKIPMPVYLNTGEGKRHGGPYRNPPLAPGHHAVARAIAKLVLDGPAKDTPATPPATPAKAKGVKRKK